MMLDATPYRNWSLHAKIYLGWLAFGALLKQSGQTVHKMCTIMSAELSPKPQRHDIVVTLRMVGRYQCGANLRVS